MKLEFHTFKIYLTVFLLRATVTHGFPQDKITVNVTRVVSNEIKPEYIRKDFDKSRDVIMYHENRDDGVLKSLCWAELFVITENNRNREKNLTNEFAIILESPGNIARENYSEGSVEDYILFDSETNKSRTLNFTIVNTTKEFTIKQHKTLHCGAGPILIKTYIEWPKRNKQKIQITLAPTTPSKWKIYSNKSLEYGANTLATSFQTFDTTNTESYSYTNLKDVTISMLGEDTNEGRVNKKSTHERNKGSDDLNVGSKHEYESEETLQNQAKSRTNRKNNTKERVLKPSNINFTIDKDRLNGLKLGMKRELLMRNMYFKKLSDSESIFSITEPNLVDNLEYDAALYFFDLIYLNKSASLFTLKGHHKFLIDVQVSIEHIIIENVNGTEREIPQSVTVLEEENVYRLKRN